MKDSKIKRKKTRQIAVGKVKIGGFAPIAVQSMTNTPTQDIAATVAQIVRLQEAGCEIVRVAVPDQDAAEALAAIKEQIDINGSFEHKIPLIMHTVTNLNAKEHILFKVTGVDMQGVEFTQPTINAEFQLESTLNICSKYVERTMQKAQTMNELIKMDKDNLFHQLLAIAKNGE